MRQEDIDERLVDWELARLRGEEIDAEELLADSGAWRSYLEQRLEVLRKTSWMLDDPVSEPPSPEVSALVIGAEATVENSLPEQETPVTREKPEKGMSDRGQNAGHMTGNAAETWVGSDGVDSPLGFAAEMPNVPGFRCLGRLGKGGFGVVYRALDEALQRQVAIKFPLIGGQRERQKYVAEARNASQVDVPGIVPIYAVGQTEDGTPYVIQKLIEGKSLRAILQFGGCLSPSQTAELFARICRAVAAAHARALVHRDLKPDNVLIDQQGLPWITDFGLSVSEDDPHGPVAGVAGTPHFMSPEQIMGKVEWLDGRCDIWALGVMLYQCLTGRLPFNSSTQSGLQEKILNFEPRPIAQRQPNLRGNWDRIFRKCCAKPISERYNNTLEMADDLAQLGRGLAAYSEKHNPVLQELQASDPSRSRARGVARWRGYQLGPISGLALGALTLVLAVISVMLLQQLRPTEEIIVSQHGSGTHRSIQAALAAATATTNIFIEPGVYRESLVVGRQLTLRGRGPADQIRIIGSDAPAITVNIGGQLAAYGLSIEVDDATDGTWNAIDVRGGTVLLDECTVRANEYDCVRLQAGSGLNAINCEFHNSLHPAIFAQLANEVNVRECRFHIGGDGTGQTNYLAGMQILQSGGSVSDCSFMGTSAVGIEWRATSDLVTINDCDFNNLERAIVATACPQLQLGGHGRAAFDNCHTAIELSGCGGSIKNCNIEARGRSDGRGILIYGTAHPETPVELQACQIRGAQAPLVLSQAKVTATSLSIDGSAETGIRLLDNSTLELSSSHIRNCEVAGLLLEGSRARLQRCTLAANETAGVVVDGLEDAFYADSCLIDDNSVGIVVLSGAARLENTQIQRATTGILLARRHLLTFAATCDAQLSLTVTGGTVTARQHAVQFLSPGSYRIANSQTSDPDNQPVLDSALQRVASADLNEVRVIASDRRSPTGTE